MNGKDHVGIEIGTCRGESAYHILQNCPNVKKLYTIDPYLEFEDWVGTIPQATLDKNREIATENLKKFGSRVEMIHKKSSDAMDKFLPHSVDFLFVDGDHSKDGTRDDLVNYFKFVKPGGIIMGHDHNLLTVREGISEFRTICKCRNPLQMVSNQAWFILR